MNEPTPYDTGNNKWIARVLKPASGSGPYYQVRFTENIPGEYTASGYIKQKTLFAKLFYFPTIKLRRAV